MSNDITGINSQRSQQTGSRSSERVSNNTAGNSQATGNTQATSSADKVSLTSTAARLKDIERQLAGEPPVDAARVNQMKSAIDRGEYDINTDRVADKMLRFERAFDGNA